MTNISPDSSLLIPSNIRNYEVIFTDSEDFIAKLVSLPNSVFVVDENVYNLYKDGLLKPLCDSIVLPFSPSEENKSFSSVAAIYSICLSMPAKKNLNLVSIGGGITQDVTGFAACTLYRGIEWTFVPTTLLAMSDSCIGSKTSLNFEQGKNLLGTFYPPSCIYLYPPFVKTLSESDFTSGLGEMAKLRIMGGKYLAESFGRNIPRLINKDLTALTREIKDCLQIKLSFIKDDEFDRGRRNLLNFGHCMGHALETASNYNIPHGQAIVVGMIFANIVAKNRKLLTPGTEKALVDILSDLCPILSKADLNKETILAGMKKDKKRTGAGLAIILLKEDRDLIKVTDLSEEEVISALVELVNILT